MFEYKSIAYCENYKKIQITDDYQIGSEGFILAVLHSGTVEVKFAEKPQLEIAESTAFICPCPCSITAVSNSAHISYMQIYGNAATLYAAEKNSPTKIGSSAFTYYSNLVAKALDILPVESDAANSAFCYHIICDLSNERDFTGANYPFLVTEALRLIKQDFAVLYGVQELSEALNVSKEHLVRVFKSAYGQTPGKHLTKTKIKAAKRLLQNRECSVEMVASLCGFSSSNYFCKVFKQQTGQSPAQFRTLTTTVMGEDKAVKQILDSWYL